ncbi:3-ketoacyl-CoA reductase, partial [Phellopilus nigrolimitatus]
IPRTFLPVVVVLGLFTISRFIAKTAGVLLQTFILPGTSIKKYASRSGNSWAVITGATDGIGKEFALQLAKAGYNILLVSRTTGKLNAVASEIATKFTSSKTKILAIDFSAPTESDYRALEEVCNELDVGILVNNVGRSHEFPVSFAQTTLDEQQAIINININGTLRVTQIVLNKMLAQHRGLVLTLSSFAGAIPSPLLATYSASKAFLQTWSDALQAELKGNGIDIECVSTYFVVSNMSRIRRATAFIPMPKTYVSSVLRKVGLSCGALWTGRPSTSTPYWSHALLDYLINVVGWKAGFIGYTHALHKDIRKRALRKKEREAISAEKQISSIQRNVSVGFPLMLVNI